METDFLNVSQCRDLNRDMHASLYENIDIVIPYDSYNVGLHGRRDVARQLSIDLPRSSVVDARGRRFEDHVELRRRTSHARFCTQCALAPVVEWFHLSNIMLMECATPLRVVVSDSGALTVCKSFRAFHHNGVLHVPSETVHLDVQLDVDDAYVLVSIRFSDRDIAARTRGATGRRRGARGSRNDGHDWTLTPFEITPSPRVECVSKSDHDHGKEVGVDQRNQDARVTGGVVKLVAPDRVVTSTRVQGANPVRVVPRKARSPTPLHRAVHNYGRVHIASSA